jgi:hypothetical protein
MKSDTERISRVGKFVIAASVIWFIIFTVYAIHRRSIVLQLLGLPVSLGFFAAFITGFVCVFTEWRQRRWFSMLPLTVCVLSIVISGKVVRMIREVIFTQSLPSCEAVVHQMESGSISVSPTLSRIPQAESEASLAYAVLAQRDTNGVLTVEFLTEAGFPVKHSGYLYTSSGTIASGSLEDSRWPIKHKERPQWFYISD